VTKAGAHEQRALALACSPGGPWARGCRGRRPVLAVTAGALIAVFAATAASAQLDESCMVSALNRTAPVDANGIWVLPNVPSGTGQLRVRATCVSGGVTRSGQSSLITVPLNGVVSVGDITFDTPQPIPASLTLGSPGGPLTAGGQTLQLAVTAAYADGSQADLTPGATGTGYVSSNAAVASVDGNGVVTAHLSGTAVISALNEGVIAVTQVQVVLSGSTVGDGIPDDWKVAHGLDPNDPYCALEDPDNDGLTNLEEYQNGTDPHNPDTDGDGLSDGDEVHIYHTNPLLWDTDGDGISDGVEVQTGSDPLNIHSFNLAAALSSITVSPAAFTLVFNTVSGEASRQLVATGNVIDGRTIDLLNPLYQTQVNSSNLAVASFGAQPGQVFAGQSGTATITVSNSGWSAASIVTVTAFSPAALAFLPLPGFQNAVAVAGDFAFVASGGAGLSVVDVTNLQAPVLIAQAATPGSANDVRVAGAVAYVAEDVGLQLVDVSDPAHPARLGSLSLPGGDQARLAVAGNLVYLADLNFGLHVVDVTNPMQPIEVGSLALAGTPRAVSLGGTGLGGFALTGSYAVVACGDGGVAVVDVSDPAAPFLAGATPDDQPRAGSVTVRGHYAYVAAGEEAVYGGLHVVELADPTDPVEVGASEDDLGVTRAVLQDGFALGAQFFLAAQVAIFDVGSLPPLYTAVLDLSTLPGSETVVAPRANDVAVRNGAVFLAANGQQLGEFARVATAQGGLYTGLFALPNDGDTTPPTVSVTAPAPGSVVMERLPVTVTVAAQDEVSVTSVGILVNGALVETLYKPPYQATLEVPAGQSTMTLGAVATNISGVQATAQETLTVQPYPLPVATLLAPSPGQTLLDGTPLTIAVAASDAVAVTRVEVYVNGQLVGTAVTPPYLFQVTLPRGSATLAVTALAYNALEPGTMSAPVLVTVQPDVPPTVAIFSPLDGAQVTEGSVVSIVAGASDLTGIAAVEFDLDGVEFQGTGTAPYVAQIVAPPAGQTLVLDVVATDNVHLAAQSAAVTITSVVDPGTAVSGYVLDPTGAGVSGASLIVAAGAFSATATSGGDGSFTVSGLPTGSGDFEVSAVGTVNGCQAEGAAEVPPPPPGANESLGNLTLVPPPAPQPTTVTGIILGADGQGLPGVTVTVSSADLADTATVASGPGGAFTVPAFPARAWTLQAEATITSGGVLFYAASGPNGPHAVAGGTTDLGSLTLQPYPFTGPDPLTTVTGQAINLDGSAAAGAQVVIDTGDGQIVATAAGDGSFAVPEVPTLQGAIVITASLHLPCNVLLVGGPLTVSQLIAGGQTAVSLPQLVPDPGPPPPIIFAAATVAGVAGWPPDGARCVAATGAAGGPFATQATATELRR
jgi:hypothetical protein